MTERRVLRRQPVMHTLYRHYGGILSQRREDAGMDLETVSHLTGISVEEIHDIEIGKIEPTISEFANMMDLYGHDVVFEAREHEVIFDPDFGDRILTKQLMKKLNQKYDRLGRPK